MATSSSGFEVPKNLSPRSKAMNQGQNHDYKDYDIKVVALFALRCIRSSNIQNMWMATNLADCGSFDDIVLHVETEQKKQITYLLQLKYKMNGVDINAFDFRRYNKNLSVRRYYKRMKQIEERINDQFDTRSEIINHFRKHRDSTIFILYTNRGVTNNNFLNDVNKNSEIDQKWLLYETLNTNNGCVSSFDVARMQFTLEPENKDLMNRLFLFTKQIHLQEIDAEIKMELSKFLGKIGKDKERLYKHKSSELIQPYVQFITDWYNGDLDDCYPLTKEQIYAMLLANIMKPYMRSFSNIEFHKEIKSYDSYEIWKKIMLEKSVTLIQTDELVDNFVLGYISKEVNSYLADKKNQNLWDKQSGTHGNFMMKTVNRSKQIEPLEAYEILWKTKKIPLLLNVDTPEELDSLMELLHMFPKIFLTIILTKMAPDVKDNKYLLTSLHNLDNKEVQAAILEYPVKLQGREFTQLSKILGKNDLNQISVKDVIYILTDEFNLGSKCPPLPDLFIDRSLKAM